VRLPKRAPFRSHVNTAAGRVKGFEKNQQAAFEANFFFINNRHRCRLSPIVLGPKRSGKQQIVKSRAGRFLGQPQIERGLKLQKRQQAAGNKGVFLGGGKKKKKKLFSPN